MVEECMGVYDTGQLRCAHDFLFILAHLFLFYLRLDEMHKQTLC